MYTRKLQVNSHGVKDAVGVGTEYEHFAYDNDKKKRGENSK